MTNKISFKANYIKPCIIRNCSKKATSPNFVSSFIELNPNSSADMEALRGINSLWGRGSRGFAANILDDFEDEIDWETSNKKYYALTQQNDRFETPMADKILGLAEIIKGRRIKIKYLQTNPQEMFDSKERNFKGIGTAILDSLRTIFSKKDIILEPTPNSEKFYEIYGFQKIVSNRSDVIFKNSESTVISKEQ